MKKHYRTETDCLNCGAFVQGHFCSDCGQENLVLHEPILHFVGHSFSHYFHFDSKITKTLKALVTEPGKLTVEYFAGKRSKYLLPLNVYLFISFFVLAVGTLFQGPEEAPKKSEDLKTFNIGYGSFNLHIQNQTLIDEGNLQIGARTDLFEKTVDEYLKKQDSLPIEQRDGFIARLIHGLYP